MATFLRQLERCYFAVEFTICHRICRFVNAIAQEVARVRNATKLPLTWYLTSRSEYETAGAGIASAWRETIGKNFPPSTLLYIDGLVDARAKVEIEVTAFVPAA